jgi:hypothetical protein
MEYINWIPEIGERNYEDLQIVLKEMLEDVNSEEKVSIIEKGEIDVRNRVFLA